MDTPEADRIGPRAFTTATTGTPVIARRDSVRLARSLLIAFGALLGLGALALCLRPAAQLIGRPLNEDGYLLLSVSRNLAIGHGLSTDGAHLTNGFQPLFTVVASLPYLLTGGNRVTALRGVLALNLLCFTLTGYLLGLVCRSMFAAGTRAHRLAGPLGAVLYLSAGYAILDSFNGLETGTLLLVYALAWWYWSAHDLTTLWQQLALGGILGAAVLTRIDCVFLVITVTCYFAWRRRLRAAVIAAVVPTVISAPWWIYNLVLTGSPMPTSGHAEHAWAVSGARLGVMIQAILVNLVPWLVLNHLGVLWVTVLSLAFLALVAAGYFRLARMTTPAPTGPASGAVGSFGGIIAVTLTLLSAWYLFYSDATFFYFRYLAPLMLISTAGGAWLLTRAIGSRPPLALASLAAAPALAGLVLLAALFAGHLVPANICLTQQLALVSSRVPPGAVVASGQTGTLSYFWGQALNLDGKSNIDALARADRMPEYLDALAIHWFCDVPGGVSRYLGPDPGARGWHEVAARGDFQLWYRA